MLLLVRFHNEFYIDELISTFFVFHGQIMHFCSNAMVCVTTLIFLYTNLVSYIS